MTSYKKLKSIIWKLTGILFSLVLFSTYFSAGLAAKYISRGEGGDSARVAKFSYEITGANSLISQPLDVSLYPGASQSFEVTLVNKGEVALRCVITAENTTKNLPIFGDGMDENSYEKYVSEVNVPINGSATNTFTIAWDKEYNDPSFAGQVDNIVLTVSIEQID